MDASSALQTLSIILQVVIILTCLIIGAKKGGIALGLIAGIGLLVLVFGSVWSRVRLRSMSSSPSWPSSGAQPLSSSPADWTS